MNIREYPALYLSTK